MMIVDNSFLYDENVKRLGLAITGAVFCHAFILAWFLMPISQKIISSDTFSAPTNVSIHFINPVKQPTKPVVKKVVKAKVQKSLPQVLNEVAPAAALPQTPSKLSSSKPTEIVKAVEKIIPVVRGANLKGRRIQPEYPKRSLRLGQEGVVWLHVLISETGSRQDIKLYKPSQYALLNQAALKAVKKWTFDPNMINGRAVKSWVEIPIEFKIQ